MAMLLILLLLFIIAMIAMVLMLLDVAIGGVSKLYKSSLTDEEFDLLTEKILSDPRLAIDTWHVIGGGHRVWIANGSAFFDIDGHNQFTIWQIRRFMKRVKQIRKDKARRSFITPDMEDKLFYDSVDEALDK